MRLYHSAAGYRRVYERARLRVTVRLAAGAAVVALAVLPSVDVLNAVADAHPLVAMGDALAYLSSRVVWRVEHSGRVDEWNHDADAKRPERVERETIVLDRDCAPEWRPAREE